MKRSRDILAGVALAALLISGSCAHVGPVVDCFGEHVNGGDVARVQEDLGTRNFADLVAFAVERGWPLVDCIISDREKAKPELRDAARDFRKAHAKELGKPEAMNEPVKNSVPRMASYREAVAICEAHGGDPIVCDALAAGLDGAPVWNGDLAIDWDALSIEWPGDDEPTITLARDAVLWRI